MIPPEQNSPNMTIYLCIRSCFVCYGLQGFRKYMYLCCTQRTVGSYDLNSVTNLLQGLSFFQHMYTYKLCTPRSYFDWVISTLQAMWRIPLYIRVLTAKAFDREIEKDKYSFL